MTEALPLYMGMPSGGIEWVGDPLEEYIYRDLQWPPEFVGWLIESRYHYRLQMPNPQGIVCAIFRLYFIFPLFFAYCSPSWVYTVLAECALCVFCH